jgi:hypothetical protein
MPPEMMHMQPNNWMRGYGDDYEQGRQDQQVVEEVLEDTDNYELNFLKVAKNDRLNPI